MDPYQTKQFEIEKIKMNQTINLLICYAVTAKIINYVVLSGYKPNWALTNKV